MVGKTIVIGTALLGLATTLSATDNELQVFESVFEDSTEEASETAPSVASMEAVSLNDSVAEIDRKLTDDEFKQLWTFYRPNFSELLDATFTDEVKVGNRYWTSIETAQDSVLDDFVVARSWLIENGVFERPTKIAVGVDSCKAERVTDWYKSSDQTLKSDAVSMLYKGIFGPIDSRVLDYAYTDADLVQTHQYLVSGNVYEQYIQKSVEKGVISTAELSDKLLGDWWSDTATWHQAQGAFGRLAVAANGYDWTTCANCWGRSFEFVQDNETLTVTPQKPSYFTNENMTLLDLLSLVEKYLRVSEKEVTKTEASIVAYKYGMEYLHELSEDEYATVEFLIAKGVISFEDYNDLGFFENVTWKTAFPIIYRAVNKDARFNFSLVQLTDDEAFWQEKGFSAASFSLIVPETNDVLLETSSVEEGATIIAKLQSLFSASAAVKTKKYSVVKDFDTVNTYTYKGLKLSELQELYNTGNGSVTSCPEITKIAETTVNGSSVVRITFSVVATSSTRAIQIIDDNISAVVKDATSYQLAGLIKIRDGKEIRMISKSTLQKCFGDKIDFIEDKVLRSVETGALACVLPDAGYAFVGNQVYVDETLIATDTNDDVYYNFDIVSSLLGMSVVEFYADSVSTKRIASMASVSTVNLYNSSGTEQGVVEYLPATISGSDENATISFKGNVSGVKSNYYCVNQIPNGINSVYRIFYEKFNSKSNAKKEPFVVLVDWVYAVPSIDDFNAAAILPEELSTGSTATWNDVFTTLYTPPEEGTPLRTWWDTNIAMSQGLTTMLFGQPLVEYVKCGYMVPRISVLLPNTANKKYFGKKSLSEVSKLLVSHGFAVPSSYSSVVNTSGDFLTDYYVDYKGLTDSNASYTSLRTIANTYREITVLKGKEYGSSYKEARNYSFGDEFYSEGSQILYRSVTSDTRLEATTASDGKLKKLVVKDRLSVSSPNATVGATVKCNIDGTTRDFIYLGVVNKSTGSGKYNQYVKLAPAYLSMTNDLPIFTLKSDGSVTYNSGQHYKTWQECVKAFYTGIGVSPDMITEDEFLNSLFSDESGKETFIIEKLEAGTTRTVSSKSFNFGLYYNNSLGAYRADKSGWTPIASLNTKVYGLPCIYLPAGDFYVYESQGEWRLGTGKTSYLLNQSTLYYSGIVDGVIDTILAQGAKVTTIDKLDDGTTLLIGDTKWIKEGGLWNSYPIKNSNAASIAQQGSAYAMTAFANIFSSYPINCDSVSMPLINYVKSCTLSNNFLSKIPKKTICVTLGDNGTAQLYKKTAKKKLKKIGGSASATYLLLRVSFDDTLLVRPVTSNGVYKVCNTASEKIISGTQVPFFNEDLSYADDNQTFFNLNQGGFENTAAFEIEKSEFNLEYQDAWFRDFRTVLIVIIAVASSYMLMMSWGVYLVITKGAGAWLFEALAGRVHGHQYGKGIDVIRLMSFGVYNLDTPPVFSRCVVVTMICLCIIAVCANFI